jgi:hypothetical protein
VGLRTDPPVFPGIATITSDECLGANFSGSVCADTTASQTVFSNGVSSLLDAEQFFSPVALIGDRTTITLDATSGGSAEFMSLSESVVALPEPAPVLSVLIGMVILVARRRRCS